MKLTVNKPTEIEPKFIRCNVAVRYDEEDIPSNFPFRKGDMWDVTVEIDTGRKRKCTPENVKTSFFRDDN